MITTTDNRKNATKRSILYGIITSLLLLPVEISFCSIIFHDDVFTPQLPQLIKLVMFSCAIHQLCFTITSTLPFAVGQVQDAGLIFLSAIASNVAMSCEVKAMIIPTTLVILSICTATLGLMLMIISKLKLASLVQYLPMPVIGGYLAYIGFYCGIAGLMMMSGVDNIINVFTSSQHIALIAPGVFAGVGMYIALRNIQSPFVLPCSFAIVLLTFYGTIFASGMTLEDAREQGWISPLVPTATAIDAWTLFDFQRVQWNLLPNQFFRLLGMFFVVSFSSSLDVAAIEMELGMPLDYNRELYTVGISNFISGMLGGYSGSYIFSPTILQLKAGVNQRLCGLVIVVIELIVVFIPVSLTSYIPKLFFGSLLVLISVDLMHDWLISSRNRMGLPEYSVSLATFAFILIFGIEKGMMAGIIIAMCLFIIQYSKLQSVSPIMLRTSTVVRSFEDRSLLNAFRGKIVTIGFEGYIFFGSAVKMLEEIKSKLVVATDLEDQTAVDTATSHRARKRKDNGMITFSISQPFVSGNKSGKASTKRKRVHQFDNRRNGDYDEVISIENTSESATFTKNPSIGNGTYSDIRSCRNTTGTMATEFLILDFAHVVGIDATAAKSCFKTLSNLMKIANVTIVFANLTSSMQAILSAQGVIDSDSSIVISTLDDALEWCEDQVLTRYRSMMEHANPTATSIPPSQQCIERDSNTRVSFEPPMDAAFSPLHRTQTIPEVDSDSKSTARSLQSILEEYLSCGHFAVINEEDPNSIGSMSSMEALLSNEEEFIKYFKKETFEKGQILFDIDDYADKIYFIAAGIVEVVTMTATALEETRYLQAETMLNLTKNRKYHDEKVVTRVNKVSSGGICGECDFFLDRNHSVRAYTLQPTICWSLHKLQFYEMQKYHPQLCNIIQYTLLKSLSLSATCALYSLNPATAYDSSDIV